jgi:hypothetical protein
LLHETFLFENVNVEKLVFSGVFFERFGDPFVAVTYQNDYKLLLTQFDIRIHVHGIVILEDTAYGGFELAFIFVVHGDANSDLGELIPQHGQLLHSAQHTGGFDLSVYAIRSETSWSDARVQLGASQGDGLEGNVFGRFPQGCLRQRDCFSIGVTLVIEVFLALIVHIPVQILLTELLLLFLPQRLLELLVAPHFATRLFS